MEFEFTREPDTSVVPVYLQVKEAIFRQWAKINDIYKDYLIRNNNMTKKTLCTEVQSMLLLLISALDHKFNKTSQTKTLKSKYPIFFKAYYDLKNSINADSDKDLMSVNEDNVIRLIIEIAGILNFYNITNITMSTQNDIDAFSGV